ncbi:MAG: enoyl-CoA hydratase/isomerase family protein [Chloroflexi bacterium]|nr:enoyl-CoA hydratase/isomerase family protein [Chloroflexota bacterium]
MTYQYIIYEVVEDHIGLITLNRPRALNALVPQMRIEWADALEVARADDQVRVVVITGAGTAFGTGIDVRDVAARRKAADAPGLPDEHAETTEHLFRTIIRFDKPYIAAVNGPVQGLDWVSLCDMRIASERASFASRYVRMGTTPAIAGCWTLPHIVGYGAAAELIWTSRPMDAAEALRLGYVSRVVPHEQLMPATMDLARRIAQGAPLAVRKCKDLMRRCWDMDAEQAFALTVETQAWLHNTEDGQEGRRAWLEKREPKFTGR